MVPLNDTKGVALPVEMEVDVIGIPDTADTEILFYDDDLGTLVAYTGGAFTGSVTGGSVVLAGGVYTFKFTPAAQLPYRSTALLGCYDIGAEIGFSEFFTQVDPEVTAGWADTQPIEAHLGTALTLYPNMENFRVAVVAACTTDPTRTDIANKRMATLLHLTELGDFLASRNTQVIPQMTKDFTATSASVSQILAVAASNERYFWNGLVELEQAGLSVKWTQLIKDHYNGPSIPHKASAVSLAVHLAVILENSLL